MKKADLKFNYFVGNVFIAVANELRNINITKATLDVETKKVTYSYEFNGKTFSDVAIDKCYATEAAFKKGECMTPTNVNGYILYSDGVNTDYNRDTDDISFFVYTFDGINTEKVFVDALKVDADERGRSTYHFSNLPEKCYLSREEALAMNEYDVVDNDGKREHRVGIGLQMALTDKQKELVSRLESLMKEFDDNNLKLFQVHWCDIHAVNVENFDTKVGFVGDFDEDEQDYTISDTNIRKYFQRVNMRLSELNEGGDDVVLVNAKNKSRE